MSACIKLSQVAMKPWDFTLYETSDGAAVLKVISVEGAYKIEVDRFFLIGPMHSVSRMVDFLEALAEDIRENYPHVPFEELPKSCVVLRQ
ncbi:hypothetical protein [Mycolicibacterium smegmatis]|nr:hypothetical protein [Mycolicibacterium smegmatis]AIU07082.1 hypothetical protein LJ00_09280 [Mycolicibacterium smegmatis MC2 155]AIU13707.1 hypothetical protein LI99_09280 [Mycolicibacterium smegmatis]AIU20331.1 hypothetical protein LI98_09280 [Mycolicibacterium smegmatis]MBE9622351.1 hypothetical protein [Mycolicibacterium smegmatis]MBE9628761.1 hypothetical protein [Mycolicibacterium smegmatis]